MKHKLRLIKAKLNNIRRLPKKDFVYLFAFFITVSLVVLVNLWLLLFSQFGYINKEKKVVNLLQDYIFLVAQDYINNVADPYNFSKDDFQNLLENSFNYLSDKNSKVKLFLNSESKFSYEALSGSSYKICYGFKTSPEIREKYGIINKDPRFVNNDWTFKWMPPWIGIKKDSSKFENSLYIDCYTVSFLFVY